MKSCRSVLSGAMLALLLGACSGGGGGSDGEKDAAECDPPAAVSAVDLKKLPKGLALDDYGTVVKASTRAGYVGAQAIGKNTIVELYPQINRDIIDAGYQIVSGENEGFEAEVFFQKGRNTGTFLLREGPCKGQVTVKLIYGATKPGKS